MLLDKYTFMFDVVEWEHRVPIEFPLDLVAPGNDLSLDKTLIYYDGGPILSDSNLDFVVVPACIDKMGLNDACKLFIDTLIENVKRLNLPKRRLFSNSMSKSVPYNGIRLDYNQDALIMVHSGDKFGLACLSLRSIHIQ